MGKLKTLCKGVAVFLRAVFGWGIYLSLFAGGLTFFGYIAALCIGGETATAICLFLSKTAMPLVIKTATVMVLVGLAVMYLDGETALTSQKKKR